MEHIGLVCSMRCFALPMHSGRVEVRFNPHLRGSTVRVGYWRLIGGTVPLYSQFGCLPDARRVVIMMESSFKIHHQIVTLSFLLRFFFISYVWTMATYIHVPRLIREDEGMSRTGTPWGSWWTLVRPSR